MSLYKMILVDDEEDVRESIERKVDWKALGFELVGTPGNGQEALELAEQMHIDVVMTDIKMPFMDGLTLCAKLKENYKNTKVVVYSGFDDFEFAREAIHLEVEEYLLKPISARDLEKVFKNLKENLDKEFDERRNMENLYEYYQKSLPMMKEQLLGGMLEGRISSEQAETLIHTYEMDFFAPYYAVAVLKADTRSLGKNIQSGQMLTISLLNLTREYLEKNMKTHSLMYLDTVVVIAQLQSPKEIGEFIYHGNQICKIGNRMLEVNVAAGIGHAYTQLGKISVSYEEARNAFDYRVIVNDHNQAIYINDVEPQVPVETIPEATGLSEVLHSIKFGSGQELSEAVGEFAGELKNTRLSIQQYQLVFMETITEVLKLARNYQLDITEIFGRNFDPYQEIGKFHSIDEMSEWLKEKCSKIRHMLRKERTDSTNLLTEKAKQYIEENYSNSDLSVENLSNFLNVSATYFSTIFKKEVGMSFVSYLTKVRLEHAVELLDHTEDKSYRIAEQVGYTEPNYFSYVFKKQYGVSPSRYRTSREKL